MSRKKLSAYNTEPFLSFLFINEICGSIEWCSRQQKTGAQWTMEVEFLKVKKLERKANLWRRWKLQNHRAITMPIEIERFLCRSIIVTLFTFWYPEYKAWRNSWSARMYPTCSMKNVRQRLQIFSHSHLKIHHLPALYVENFADYTR